MVSNLSILLKMSASVLRYCDLSARPTHRRMKHRRRETAVDALEVRMLLSATALSALDNHDHNPVAADFVPQTFSVQRTGQFLTTAQQGKPLEIAAKFLINNSSSFGISANDWQYRVSSSTVSGQTGTTHIYLQQTLGGMDVLNAVANVNIARDGAVMSAYSSFVTTSGTVASKSLAFSAAQALTSFATDVGLGAVGAITSTYYASSNVPAKVIRFGKTDVTLLSAPAISRTQIPAEPVYIPVKGGLERGWRLNVQTAAGSHWYDAGVSAVDGEVLSVVDWSSDASYNVFAQPKESPSDGGRTNLLNPQDAQASPFGWHDTNGVAGAEFTVTQGNNVSAYTDTDANNLPDAASSPDGGASLVFNFPLNLVTQEPAAYRPAAVTNLFYWNNLIHDVLQHQGFDEASGNFQVTNYSGQGTGGDPVLAEAQDGSGTNNANFGTPPEGTSPRMQMFRWTSTSPARDSDLDNGVIIHEYGHGVSNRLTGGPANSSALTTIQSGGMGEGWSDFWALMFTQIAADQANDGRGIGTYVLGQAPDGAGIRTKRYSYDFSVNNHTFADIVGSNSVHFVGETWATTLWDLNWALIGGSSLDPNLTNVGLGFDSDLYNGTGGNNLLMKLVLEGMKLQPVNPSLLQARDAILQADVALTGGANQATIWTVFARRGMGLSASDSGSGNTSVVQAFDVPIITNLVFPGYVLPGSQVSRIQSRIATPLSAGETRTLRFFGEAKSKITMTLTPDNPATLLTATIRRADGTLVYGPFVAGGAGQPVVISPSLLANNGNYKLEILSSLASGVAVDAVRNAGLEAQSGDSTPTSEVNVNNTFINVGVSRGAVIGHSNAGLTATRQNSPGSFVDISATGTALNLSDDGVAAITTTVGNSLLPAGAVTVSNNGHVQPGSSPGVSFTNSALSAAIPGLFPYWDDIDSDTGNVYWEERSVGGINTLIVQWHNRPHFSNTGSATFQLQLFATGNTLVRYAYQDVVFDNVSLDNGASATIGVVGAGGVVSQQSFNTLNSVVNGDKIDYSLLTDFDEYQFNALAGQRIDVIFDGLQNVGMRGSQVKLMQGATVLANAVPNPLGGGVTAANYDLGIAGFLIPTNGLYTIRVVGKVAGDYLALVTKDGVFDTENSTGNPSPRRTISAGVSAMGFLDSSTDTSDEYLLTLSAGQQVQIDVGRPFGNPSNSPLNSLVPRLQLRSPTGTLLATNTNSGAGGLPKIVFTAATAGSYRVNTSALSGSGEYTIKVATVTAATFSQSASGETARLGIVAAAVSNTQAARPSLNWKPVAGAASYSILVDHIGGQSGVINQSEIAGTSYLPATTLPSGNYRVWLRAVGADGAAGSWSSPLNLTIADSERTPDTFGPRLEIELLELPGVLDQQNLIAVDQNTGVTAQHRRALARLQVESIPDSQSSDLKIGELGAITHAAISPVLSVPDRFTNDFTSLDFLLSKSDFGGWDG